MCSLLDQVVQAFYTGAGEQVSPSLASCLHQSSPAVCVRPRADHTKQQTAQRVLTQFQESQDAWQRVPAVLETSQNLNTKVGPSSQLSRRFN